MKKYLISFTGHGAESVFIKLTPEQYSWWWQATQDEDFCIEDYLIDPENFDYAIPDEMNILKIGDGEFQEWDSNDLIFEHYNSPDLVHCELTIEEVVEDAEEHYQEVLSQPLDEFNDEYDCFTEQEVVIREIPEQVLEINNYEKGCLYGAIIEVESFDPTKLKILTDEAPNGNIYLCGVFYDGEELCNTESCTRGKGMVASVWEE